MHLRVEEYEFHGTATEIVEQMRDKSILHKDTPAEKFVDVLVENLALNQVQIAFADGISHAEKCQQVLEVSIAAGLSRRL